jgi:integrase/recombinase XerD
MKCIINNQVVLSRPPEGPLVALSGWFAKSVSEQGYSLGSVHRRVLRAACFRRWLKQKGVGLRSMCSDHAVRYLRYRARNARPCRGDAAALRQLIGFLRRQGVIPNEKKLACPTTPTEFCAQAFGQYLLEVRALARPTILNYVPFIRSFLEDRFGSGQVTLSRLCAGDVVRFVQRQAPRLHKKTVKLMTTALRSFLQYARYLGEVTLDLAAAVPIVAHWSMTSIPRAISAEHVRQLLASVDRRTAVGRRDYALLLLRARWGLRSGEVAFLELGDIDWNAGQLNVRGKSGQRNKLPLPTEVGKAIASDGAPPHFLHHHSISARWGSTTGRRPNQRDSVEWSFNLPGNLLELFHREAARLAYAFRCAFDRDQFHRIALHGHVAAPHGEVP